MTVPSQSHHSRGEQLLGQVGAELAGWLQSLMGSARQVPAGHGLALAPLPLINWLGSF